MDGAGYFLQHAAVGHKLGLQSAKAALNFLPVGTARDVRVYKSDNLPRPSGGGPGKNEHTMPEEGRIVLTTTLAEA